MAKIPDQNAIPDPRFTSARGVEHIDAHAMGAPGRALQGLGQSLASLGAAIGANPDGLTDEQRKTQDFQTHADFLTFDIEQGDNLNAMKRDIAPDANGFRAGFAEQYDAAAREWIKGVPDRLKPKYDYMLRQRAKAYEGQARTFEDKTRDEYTIGRVSESLNGISAKMQEQPEAFNDHMERGRSLIEESPLSRHAKEKLKDAWSRQTEKNDVEQRLQRGEDPATIMKDIQTRPMGFVPGEDGAMPGAGEGGESPPAVNERGERIAGPDGGPAGGSGGRVAASGPIQLLKPPIERTSGFQRRGDIAGIVVHETQGSDTMDGNGTWSNKTNTGANYYVGKDGSIYEWAPDDIGMNHVGKFRGGKADRRADLTNQNTLAIEVMLRDGEKPTAAQLAAVKSLVAAKAGEYKLTPDDIVAHGELVPSSWKTDGSAFIADIRAAASGTRRAASAAPGGGDAVQAMATAYSPTKGASDTAGAGGEGSYASAKPGPDGKAEVRTLADVAAGRSKYVTLAGDPSQYGKEYVIPEITFRDAAGKEQTLKNVRGVVHDTGSAFRGQGNQRFDIPADKDLPDGGASQPYSKQKVAFVPRQPVPLDQRGMTAAHPLAGTKAASADQAAGISAERYTPGPNESGVPRSQDRERFVLKGDDATKARQLREIVAAGYGDVVHSLGPDGDVVSVKKGNPNWQTNGVYSKEAPDKIKNRLTDGEFVGPGWAKDIVAEMKSGRVTPPAGSRMALGAKGVQVASLGGDEIPDGAAGPSAVHDRDGVPVAEVTGRNHVATILDGIPDETPLTELPADVREGMGHLIPKDAETPVTLPNGEKVAATDLVTVGDLKAHFADPLRDAARAGDIAIEDGARVQVAQAQSQPWDKPVFSDNPKYRYLSESDRQILLHKTQTAQRALFLKAGKGEADYVKQYGVESRDDQGRTLLERAQAVLMPNQMTKLKQQIEGAKWHYRMVAPIGNMPEDDIQGHLDRMAPTQADSRDLETLALKTDAYNAAVKHAEKVRDVRRRDGALSVQGAPEVMAVWQDIRNGQKPSGTMGTGPDGKPTVPQEPAMSPVEARESLVEARLKAQERIFGDAADNRIKTITRREAEQLLRISKVDAPSEELMPLLKAAAVRADQTYGKYARRVYDDAVKMVLGANKELKEDATGVGQKLIRGESVSALERQRFQTQKSMTPVDAFLNPQATPKDFGAASGSVANGLRAPQGGGAPASEFSPALALSAEQMAQAGGKMPPMKAITWLMVDPEKRAGAFDQQFGAGAAKMVESTAARMMSMGGAGGEAVMMPRPKPQSKGWFGGLFGN